MRFIVLLFLCGCFNSNLPAPYNEVAKVLPYDGGGWYNNRRQIKKLIQENDVKTVIEIGSWLGKSTRHIARIVPKNGKVYAVDHWLGSAEHQGNENLPMLYQQFLSNVIQKKLTHKIIPVPMASVEAEKVLSNVFPDLIYIDANHEMDAVYQDLTIWFPHVRGHGILCGDDWPWPGVREAVEKFAKENDLIVESDDAFWRLIEPSLAKAEL